jgi:two-component system response regulator BaeR
MIDTGLTRRVLIAESEPALAAALRKSLYGCELTTIWIADASEILPILKSESPELLILDVALLEHGNPPLLRELRRLPCLQRCILTARLNELEHLRELDFTADDILRKPFNPREVLARVKALLRRDDCSSSYVSRFLLDEERLRAAFDGKPLDLTPVEFRLLRTLASAPGRIFSLPQLHRGLYADQRIVTKPCIAAHVKNLRRKLLAAHPGYTLIETIYGVGYKLHK